MKKLIIRLIRWYQYLISPLITPSCRFHPSCSQYAREAIDKYGTGKGILLTINRICRCHPFCHGGYDPVP